MGKYLGSTGLSYLWGKIKSRFATLQEFDGVLRDYYSKTYLTFEAIESGTFTFTGNGVSYSLNGGLTWATLTSGTASPTVAAGGKIMWKASGLDPGTSGIGTFSSTGKFNVMGNVMSMAGGDSFTSTTLTNNYQFYTLLQNSKVVSAKYLIFPSNLTEYCYAYFFNNCEYLAIAPILPATTMANRCYLRMFCECTSLTTAPYLPATTLVNRCYYRMFDGCSSLNYVKAMFTTTPSSSYTATWLRNVAASGTFVKNINATWSVSGDDGVPDGWTIQTAVM